LSDTTTGPPGNAGGQCGLSLVSQVVQYSEPRRGSAARVRQSECIRMRLTYERQVIMGRYLTAQGHRERGSVRERTLTVHWDAVICEAAIQHVRRRFAQWKRPGQRRGMKGRLIPVVAEALRQNHAPVNHYTAKAILGVFGVTCSRVWFNRALRAAGWVPIQPWEMPKGTPGYQITNWQRDGA